ncbi:hypothetical protein [Streptomyces sp. H34-S4]|uniref:hypothetical protein n=1 Tax=Streptomyces sp. H34-S4 TaxID=2996463 RepID=UPI00226EE548|nr:hypothetical protein [Streptomyces sp. H34-S4]MCY0933905.1 hypothetical protein [Streptomyces sp. H34-S4]
MGLVMDAFLALWTLPRLGSPYWAHPLAVLVTALPVITAVALRMRHEKAALP